MPIFHVIVMHIFADIRVRPKVLKFLSGAFRWLKMARRGTEI